MSSSERPDTPRLSTRHREILFHRVLGMSVKEIAIKMRMSESGVSSIVNSELFLAEQERVQRRLEERFVEKASELDRFAVDREIEKIKVGARLQAWRVLQGDMTCEHPPTRFRATKEILDRIEGTPVQRVQEEMTGEIRLTVEQLEQLASGLEGVLSGAKGSTGQGE